jgi:hypothetical protein
MKVIDTEQAVKLMNETNGNIFSVVFTKKDGSIRHMNCRTGVKKHVKGVGLAFDPSKKGLYGVFDMKNEGYRFITVSQIQGLQIAGKFYTVK